MVPVIYTRKGLKPWMRGQFLGICIVIDPEFRHDAALLAHERTHEWQALRSWGTYFIRYHLSKQYRYECELEAYREQLRLTPPERRQHALMDFTTSLACFYKLDIPIDRIRRDLEAPL